MQAFLAFLNFTDKDYVAVPFGEAGKGADGVMSGAADAAFYSVESGKAIEWAASPHGLRWLSMPPNDKAAWDRFHKLAPTLYPYRATQGPSTPADGGADDYHFAAYDWVDENLVYWMVKQKTEQYEAYKKNSPALIKWTIENAVNVDAAQLPYHPGAIKYYKEKGVWTAKHDAWQAAKVAEQEKAITNWKAKNPTWKWNSGGKK